MDRKNTYAHFDEAFQRIRTYTTSSPYCDAKKWRLDLGSTLNPDTVPCIKIYKHDSMHLGTVLLDDQARPVGFTSHIGISRHPVLLPEIPDLWKAPTNFYIVCLWFILRPPYEIGGWQKQHGWKYEPTIYD